MNCRILEQKVFNDPAVAAILQENFVEARLHVDGLNGPQNVPVRDPLTTSIANPWLVVVDPADEAVQGQSGFMREAALIEFLESIL